jgi:hypothetical protein
MGLPSRIRTLGLGGVLASACGTAASTERPAVPPAPRGLASAARAIASGLAFESLEGPFWVARTETPGLP